MGSHFLNQCWNIVNWTQRNTPQGYFNQNLNIFFHENAYEHIIYEIVAILSQPQCVNLITEWALCITPTTNHGIGFLIYALNSKKNLIKIYFSIPYPDSKVHGANMGPIWGRQDPGGPHVGPMNFAIWVNSVKWCQLVFMLPYPGYTLLQYNFHNEVTWYWKTKYSHCHKS